jgi:phosphoserine phosphatase/putative flippase GtrA
MSEVELAISKHSLDVFDFDHTIYDGDASIDFYFFALRKHPSIVRFFPIQIWYVFLYLTSAITRKEFKEGFFHFLVGLTDVNEDVERFWATNGKIKKWYEVRSHTEDVIISASPEFLLKPMAQKIRAKRLIATRMDQNTGKITGENCRGTEKVVRLKTEFPNANINECYTDSLADLPILELAKKRYIVRKEQIIDFDDYQPSQLKERFVSKKFLSFLFVGALNAFIGLSFAFAASNFLGNKTVAYMIGYSIGLIPSYFLNSTITFHNRDYNLGAFMRYCISYIPNLIVQTVCVGLLIEILSVNKAVAYIVAVMVGVPVTYLLVSVFAIRDRELD